MSPSAIRISLMDISLASGGLSKPPRQVIMYMPGWSLDSSFMRTVRMKLKSEQQPGMYMLTCRGGLDNPPDAREISINEMRVALGDKAAILLPDGH